MSNKIFVDRSRYETYGRCPRSRFLEYHFAGAGIVSARRPLPLAVGGSVHHGLEVLLREGQAKLTFNYPDEELSWMNIEEHAVEKALADFAEYQSALELPDAERTAAVEPNTIRNLDEAMSVRSEMDEYLFREQSALVEAMVRAYARRRLRPLLEQFEVLEVEREGEWKLSEWTADYTGRSLPIYDSHAIPHELWFMSRPDALLRERESNQLYLLSYKTAASWDVRKARDAEHDMQGMSEGIEIERRLAEWWENIHRIVKAVGEPKDRSKWDYHYPNSETVIPNAMCNFLLGLDAPPRILAVRMEFLLKGERWKDRDLSERFGVEMRSQKSHLIRQYVAVSTPARGTAGYNIGDVNWSWDFIREDGRESSLAWQNWKSRQVENVKEWIDKLDDAAETMSAEDSTMGLEPRLLGYKCDAQAVGVTRQHPLDAVFIPPITIFRNTDDLRDLVEQMEHQERRIAEGVAQVNAATEDGEQRSLLNQFFPQTRRACEYPTTCAFVSICYGGDDIRKNPLDSGKYKVRIPNHPQEGSNNGETKP